MNPKTKKIIGNVVFVILIGLLIWPTSRSYFQQMLMKIGLFKPTLEVPKRLLSRLMLEEICQQYRFFC
ncbi:hypothetical protein KUH03_36620 [Sphingobacterium sp. E70]|uniref:hypothetical protein n=1 Tax=Sphingobacterium sp. E70 TaxID=2853439 RepID=UPI00211CD8E6|nr:hypothetical protein [Sphingobacterium sp. E70]ULT24449.1 hypothetical protein KUH03_36620 [Sphingobacterium sp. E70]